LIEKCDALIIGGNILSIYTGILFEKNGMNVTIIEDDLYGSLLSQGPLFFIDFDDEKRGLLNKKSREIYYSFIKKSNFGFVWPIDLYDKLKENFHGHILNFSNKESFSLNNKSVKLMNLNKEIISEFIIVLDGILIKKFLLEKNIDLKNEIQDYGNMVLYSKGKNNFTFYENDLIVKRDDLIYLSGTWEKSYVNTIKKMLNLGVKINSEIKSSIIKRFWKSKHDTFKDGMPRLGNLLYENLYFMAGYSRFGISLGLELSKLLTQFVLGKPLDIDFDFIIQ